MINIGSILIARSHRIKDFKIRLCIVNNHDI